MLSQKEMGDSIKSGKIKIYLWDTSISVKGDRSLGNRFYMWETLQYLNSQNNFGFEIKLLESDFPWVKNGLVTLPNTSTYTQSEIPSDVFYLNPHKTIEELWPYYWDGEKFPLKDSVITFHGGVNAYNFRKNYSREWREATPDRLPTFFKDIQFNKELFQKTGEVAKDISMTIHVRRGNGCKYPQKYIDEIMSEKSKKYFLYKGDVKINTSSSELELDLSAKKIAVDNAEEGASLEWYQIKNDAIHEFYEDDIYFDIFDKILKINSGAKICLVHDTFDEDYNHWFEKYLKNLVTSRQLLNKEDFSDPILKNEEDDILRSFIDLLILLQTRSSFLADSSTFSRVSHDMKEYYEPSQWFYNSTWMSKVTSKKVDKVK